MTSNQSVLEDPPACSFTNWDDFYPIALRYHQSTHHGDDLVIDRIETFRRYMSEDVIEYLGGFVRSHPRFTTSEGWTQWCDNVAEMLSISSLVRDKRPAWVKKLNAKPVDEQLTAMDLISRFQKGKITINRFWKGFDAMVADNRMSSFEQRQLFWGALPEDERKRLVERCCYFDPQDEIWEKKDSELAKVSEQKLSQIMEFSVVDERITSLQSGLKFMLMFFILNLFNQIMNSHLFIRMMQISLGWTVYCYIMAAMFIITDLSLIFGTMELLKKLKTLKCKQKELLIRDLPLQ